MQPARVHADREVHGLVAHQPFVADLHAQRVEEHDRVGRLERPGLPGGDLVDHLVGDGGDEVRGDLDAVELAHVALDVARAHAAGVQRDDLVVETGKAPPVLRDQRGVESAVPVARDRQLQRPFRRQHRLRARAVAVVGNAGLGLVRQVHVHLGVEHALGQRLLQIPDQATGVQYALRITAGQQLVQQLGGKNLVVLGHTSSSPWRAVYGSSHKNPDRPS